MALLKAFNPHELSAGVVLSVATGREEPLQHILSVIRDNVSAPILQHIIVSAPRGYGKSFFLRYIEVKVAEIAKAEGLPVVMALLPEELPHVREPDTLITEIRRTFLNEPSATVGVRWTEDDGGAWDSAIARLDSAIEERFGMRDGLLIAGVENFDLLVKKAFAKPLQSGRLREFLTRSGNRIMLLTASARGSFDRNYDLPLFKAFEEVTLGPWSIDQTVEFLFAQRKAAGKPPLTIPQRARASAVATFIGGTPRLATLIGEALLEDDPLGAADLLDKIVDELTPYYKERIEILPPRSQVLLDALLRGGERCSATELARRVGAPSQAAIAAPLDDLKKDLVLIGEKAPGSAEVLLRVTDRVFAHYYRKRILSHGLESCPLEALVEILALIYSPEEKRREAEKFAARGLAREAAVMKRLWEADGDARSRIITQSSSDDPRSTFNRIMMAWERAKENKNFELGLSLLRQAIESSRENNNIADEVSALCCMASMLFEFGHLDQARATAQFATEKAKEAVEWAVQRRNTSAEISALVDLVWSLSFLNRHDEAIVAARETIDKAARAGDVQDEARALRYASLSFAALDRYDEAITFARNAATKAEQQGLTELQVSALLNIASYLNQLGRHGEAISVAHDAADKAADGGETSLQVSSKLHASYYLGMTDRNEEAVVVARDAVKLARKVDNAALEAGALSDLSWNLGQLDRYEEALEAARNSAAKASSLGLVRIQATALRQGAWQLYALSRYNEAVVMARDAADKAAIAGDLEEQSTAFLYLAWNLHELGLYDDAIASARESQSLSEAQKDVEGQVDALMSIAASLRQLNRDEESTKTWVDAENKVLQSNDRDARISLASGLLMERVPNALWMLKACEWIIQDDLSIKEELPATYFDDMAFVATSQKSWPLLASLLETVPAIADQLTKQNIAISEPGRFLARSIAEEGLEKTLSYTRHLVSALAQAADHAQETPFKRLWIAVLEATAEEFVSRIGEAETLRAFTEVYAAHPSAASQSAALLNVAAEYHASGRDPRTLARLDPDLTIMLTTIFPPKKTGRKPNQSKKGLKTRR